jgi:nicotinamidase-related amidase
MDKSGQIQSTDSLTDILVKFPDLKMPFKHSSAIILVDVQPYFYNTLTEQDREKITQPIIDMINYCKNTGTMFACVESMYHDDSTVDVFNNVINTLPNRVPTYVKDSDNAFETGPLAELMKYNNIAETIIMGMNASKCVYETMIGARLNRFKVATAQNLIADQKYFSSNYEKVRERYENRKIRVYDTHTDLIKALNDARSVL